MAALMLDELDSKEFTMYVALYLQEQHIQDEITANNVRLRSIRSETSDLELQLQTNASNIIHLLGLPGSGTLRAWSHRLNLPNWYDSVLPMLPEKAFKDHFRLSRTSFLYVTEELRGKLIKQNTTMRESIPVEKRVAIAVFKLGSCAEYRTVAELFGCGISTVCDILHEFCLAAISTLEDKFIKFPVTASELRNAAAAFEQTLGFPQAIAAVDGCHVPVSPPLENCRDYYNYKGWYSVVLFAVVDNLYRFTYVNVGSPGRCNDGHILQESSLFRRCFNGALDQEKRKIDNVDVPFLLLGDSAFPLGKNLQKPFLERGELTEKERYFNYRFCKARRVVENAFGRVKARFRIIAKRMDVDIYSVNNIIRTCCILHNMCEIIGDRPHNSWETQVSSLDVMPQPTTNTVRCIDEEGKVIRVALSNYFHSQQAHL